MVEFTAEHEQIIRETHDATLKIQTVLLGANGDEGLVGQVNDVCNSHYQLKRSFWLLIGILVGSGVITGSVIGALKLGG